ncbi:hypothetical protein GGTG_13225 [Gaeumannomyces tritici R3-111a-1]|uniref:AB hydrolase-1 domain-containing protein n=1 Tax=Gaeumannomyces tritici (strain R3-111a-1) TaxID=644352 RepID=J3PI97_GAET3|nr:hypothetical protein GGTG_13225 [Gaeumannomyces tritici R3-111a-1]EJT69609.1 hypothetical protein GGTG_13225 [Gaeumannomyces tritici R3-111a-1]
MKPAFVIVHGLTFPPPTFDRLRNALEGAGYDVAIPRMPSVGEGVIGATMATEVAAVRAAMAPALEAGKDIVLMGHSYGGIIITPTALGYTKTEREAQGLEGGVKAVVYLEAFAGWERGKYPMDVVFGSGSGIPEMFKPLVIDGKPTDNIPVPKSPTDMEKQASQFLFFNTCTPEDTEWCMGLLESMSLGAALEKTEVVPADLKASLTYIVGEKDNAMQPAIAERFVAGTPGMKEVRMDTGHAPFVSHVDELAKILEGIAQE